MCAILKCYSNKNEIKEGMFQVNIQKDILPTGIFYLLGADWDFLSLFKKKKKSHALVNLREGVRIPENEASFPLLCNE